MQARVVQQCKVHCSLSGSLWVSLSLQIIRASLAKSEPAAAAVYHQLSSYSYLPLLCQYRDRKIDEKKVSVVQQTVCHGGRTL